MPVAYEARIRPGGTTMPCWPACLSRYAIRHGQCAECLKITTAGSTGTHDRHVPSQWQATATTREHNLADRPGSIDRIDPLRPTSGDHEPSFPLEKRLDKSWECLVTRCRSSYLLGIRNMAICSLYSPRYTPPSILLAEKLRGQVMHFPCMYTGTRVSYFPRHRVKQVSSD